MPNKGLQEVSHDSSGHGILPFGFSVWFDQTQKNINTVGDVQDGIDFRRARLAAKGNVTKNISYIMEFDFAASQARFVDVWLNFAKFRFWATSASAVGVSRSGCRL